MSPHLKQTSQPNEHEGKTTEADSSDIAGTTTVTDYSFCYCFTNTINAAQIKVAVLTVDVPVQMTYNGPSTPVKYKNSLDSPSSDDTV